MITAGFLACESPQPSSLPTPRGSGMSGWQLFAYSCGGSVGFNPTSLLALDIGYPENRNATECSAIALPCQASCRAAVQNSFESNYRVCFPFSGRIGRKSNRLTAPPAHCSKMCRRRMSAGLKSKGARDDWQKAGIWRIGKNGIGDSWRWLAWWPVGVKTRVLRSARLYAREVCCLGGLQWLSAAHCRQS